VPRSPFTPSPRFRPTRGSQTVSSCGRRSVRSSLVRRQSCGSSCGRRCLPSSRTRRRSTLIHRTETCARCPRGRWTSSPTPSLSTPWARIRPSLQWSELRVGRSAGSKSLALCVSRRAVGMEYDGRVERISGHPLAVVRRPVERFAAARVRCRAPLERVKGGDYFIRENCNLH